jgi:hypothetical protein
MLMNLSYWLEQEHHQGVLLSGILYLHRISDSQIQGTALRNVHMIKKLCGKDAIDNIVPDTAFSDTYENGAEVACHENSC